MHDVPPVVEGSVVVVVVVVVVGSVEVVVSVPVDGSVPTGVVVLVVLGQVVPPRLGGGLVPLPGRVVVGLLEP